MYRKSMRSALEEARAYSAVNEVKVSKGGKTLDISKKDIGVYQAKGWSLQEANMKRILQALQDKLSDEGGAAGFDDLKKTAKSMGLDLTPAMLKDMPGIKQHRDGDYILEEQKRYMLTYGKKGEKVKAFYSDDHSDVQKKASELRGKGFVVDKMGLTQPMSKLRDRIPEQVEEETELDETKITINNIDKSLENKVMMIVKSKNLNISLSKTNDKKSIIADGDKEDIKTLEKELKEETELVEFTLADYKELESDNQHDIAAKKLIDKFGTPQEKSTINDINRRHAKTGYISGPDFKMRTMIVNRYYSRLK